MNGRWALTRNPVSLLGAAITTASALLFLILFLLDLFGYLPGPYTGLLVFVALPAAFVLGLLLIPAGLWWARRAGREFTGWPLIDFNDATTRRVAIFVSAATLANVVIISIASYGAVHYMESNSFCGQACHEVMQPEFTSYQVAPHARVDCVDCHVGSGATYFARAKMSGTRQLVGVLLGSHPRPVPTPVHNLRPARDTCEQCHWPEKFHGDTIKIVREYADDEQNSETTTKLTLHVGGGSEALGMATGIHWHMNLGNEIEYVTTDPRRQVIPYVRLRDRSGNVREFRAPGVTDEQIAQGERRQMDCMDCHSRPAHTFAPSAERAVNEALAAGRIDKALPFVRREAVAALKAEYGDQEAAAAGIARHLRDFYARSSTDGAEPSREAVDRAIAAVQDLYRHNVFPGMRVGWGTYLNEMGHTESPGCFRCHDEEHKAADGTTIRQDCEICHAIE